MWFFISPIFSVTQTHDTKTHKHHSPSRHHHKSHGHHTSKRKHHTTHGIASYYGKGDRFNGKQMANGERFNANLLIAAHPTYPFGTKLKVTNNKNGKVVYVEIKDRMPKGARIIDLSWAAAKKLGMQKSGIAPVTLEKISDREFKEHLAYNAN